MELIIMNFECKMMNLKCKTLNLNCKNYIDYMKLELYSYYTEPYFIIKKKSKMKIFTFLQTFYEKYQNLKFTNLPTFTTHLTSYDHYTIQR